MRKVKFTSNTIRENQDNINQNFDDIEALSQVITNDIQELKNKAETIPTKTSQLTNDGDGNSNFATINDVNQAIEDMHLPENIATTDYVNKEISDLVNSAPETLNTLGELANALEENEGTIDALNNMIADKASKSEIPTKTSQLQNNGNGTSKFATESYVSDALADVKVDLPDNLATTDYVDEKVAGLVNSAPETLDTLGELAIAIQENESVVGAINQSITNKADKSEIPTKLSQLTSDTNNRVVSDEQIAEWNSKSNFSGLYDDLENKPSIPTKTSQLLNDGDGNSSFATLQFVQESIDNTNVVVNTYSDQTITGTKTFSKITFFSDHVNIGSNTPNSESSHSISIGNESATDSYGVSVGYGAESQTESVALGVYAIGRNKGVGLGSSAYALNNNIQIGGGQNQKEKTLQVYDYELLDANGKIPVDRLPEGIGGADLPDNLVTTDTDQSITGTKTFDEIDFSSGVKLNAPNDSNNKIEIGKDATVNSRGIAIGFNTQIGSSGYDSVLIGKSVDARGLNAIGVGNIVSTNTYGVSLGYNSSADYQCIAIGYQAKAKNTSSIQLGYGTNPNSNTFQVFGYQMLDANGQIPIERLENVTSLIETSITGVLNTEV